jgi:hypothetical protein
MTAGKSELESATDFEETLARTSSEAQCIGLIESRDRAVRADERRRVAEMLEQWRERADPEYRRLLKLIIIKLEAMADGE